MVETPSSKSDHTFLPTPLITFSVPDDDNDEDILTEQSFRKLGLDKEENTDLRDYIQALEELALSCLRKFFKGKSFYCGGPIPQRQLFSEKSLNVVLSTDFKDGIDICYSVIDQMLRPRSVREDHTIDWQIETLLDILNQVRSSGIPKPFQTGVILLYLKFCRGCKIPENTVRNLSHILDEEEAA